MQHWDRKTKKTERQKENIHMTSNDLHKIEKRGGGGAVSSRCFDLLNSMIYDLKRSVDLNWFIDQVLHSSFDDLVFIGQTCCFWKSNIPISSKLCNFCCFQMNYLLAPKFLRVYFDKRTERKEEKWNILWTHIIHTGPASLFSWKLDINWNLQYLFKGTSMLYGQNQLSIRKNQ